LGPFGRDDGDIRSGDWRWRDDNRRIDRQAAGATEVLEVLPARHNDRMVGRQGRRRNGSRPAIERLGLSEASRSFGDNGAIVQRIGQIRMERPQLLFLEACGVSQQLISRRQVASRRRAFRPIEHVTSVLVFRHRVSGASLQYVASTCDCSPGSCLALLARRKSGDVTRRRVDGRV
jgi:hypothetical protein